MSSSEPILTVRHLTKRYGSATVVDDVSFSIEQGDVVGLIGPNGAGKSTVMKSLVGLVRPSGGHLELLGHSVGSAGWGEALTRVGSMIEAPPLYPRLTARQNLRYQMLAVGQSPDEARIDEILELVGLLDEGDHRPATFSLGMKQRLGIGITLVGRPELIILDEPANGLDPAGIREIRSLLRRLPDTGTTVLVSSHQLAEVQAACDHLVVLDRGRLVTSGSTDEIVDAGREHAFDVVVDAAELDRMLELIRTAGHEAVAVDTSHAEVRPAADVRGRDLLRALTDAGIYPDSFAPKTVSLEEAFLELTTAR